jgi:hypothetical protein
MTPAADRDEIVRALDVLVAHGDVVELRVPNSRQGVTSGYFDDMDLLADAAVALSGTAPGVYATLNPVKPALLARSPNRVTSYAKQTTKDADILQRGYLPVDIDVTKPHTNSTDAEHAAALATAANVCTWLVEVVGIAPESLLVADSGNGAYVLGRCDLPNDAASRTLVRRCLAALAHQFDSPTVHIDQTVHNAARITKCFGTVACKGPASDERPHRVARLVQVPSRFVPIAADQLTSLAAHAPRPRGGAQAAGAAAGAHDAIDDVRRYLADHGVTIKREKPGSTPGATILELTQCIFDRTHCHGEACVILFADGTSFYKCHHDSCRSKRWTDVRAALEPDAVQAARAADPRPRITTSDRLLDEITAEGLAALTAANVPPTLYTRDFTLVQLVVAASGQPQLRLVTEAALRNRLAAAAIFTRTKGRRVVDCLPPLDLVRAILAQVAWPAAIPAIAGITEMPVLRPDGSILDQPGYDPATQLLYVLAPGTVLPPIPVAPTPAECTAALTLLCEYIGDFPYANVPSTANAFAALLTPVLAPLIAGPTPLCVIDKPKPGCGASLLTEVISIIATGRPAASFSAPHGTWAEDEWRKLLTALLLTGATIAVIDNVTHPVSSPALGKAISGEAWKDRKLGASELVDLPLHLTWFLTGNNVQFGDENYTRRIYWVRFDTDDPKPWKRPPTRFRHPELIDATRAARGPLLAALLTIARSWIVAGRPTSGGPVFGTFQKWADVLHGVLQTVGITGLHGNEDEVYADLNQEDPGWATFLSAWYAAFNTTPQCVRDVVKQIRALPPTALRAALPDALIEVLNKEKGFAHTLGCALHQRRDQTFETGDEWLRLEKADPKTHAKVARYVVRPIARRAHDAATGHAADDPTPRGNGAAGPAPTTDREPGEDNPILDLAESCHWPMVPLRPGLNIGGTPAAWQQFVADLAQAAQSPVDADRRTARADWDRAIDYLTKLAAPARAAAP